MKNATAGHGDEGAQNGGANGGQDGGSDGGQGASTDEEAEIEDWIPYFDCLWENACDCRQRDANGELVDSSTLEGEAQERCQTAQEDFEGCVLGDSCEGVIYFDDIGCDYVLMKDDEGNAIDCTTLPEGEQKASCE